jgi:FkbM family methyltransferase
MNDALLSAVERRPQARFGVAAQETIAITLTPFDQRHYLKLIKARGETIRRVVMRLKPALQLATALDAGCGVGFFTQTLEECGLAARGFDGREENIKEARRRFPEMSFQRADIENPDVAKLGRFDLVLCFGLLYHLENPMLAIRHLRALSGKGLLLESMCLPGDQPGMVLRDEPRQEDQSLTEVALCPSESCLVKMLYHAGFRAVYRLTELPEHDDFRDTPEHARRRTVLFATASPAALEGFDLLTEAHERNDLWQRDLGDPSRASLVQRLQRFWAKPARAKYISMACRARRVFPEMPIPLRLPFGAWWLAERSALDSELMYNGFEGAEMGFVEKLLRPGMTVIDVGAHHGLYTLLMSRLVGRKGRVIAFEPSARECRRLAKHIRLNRCSNVLLEGVAVGEEDGDADLFVVNGHQDWCNSLRPPDVREPVQTERVVVRSLDNTLSDLRIATVDFIKLDAEGAELSFLKGALRLLRHAVRPAILAEVQDIRTSPWGYAAREIIEFLCREKYCWFALAADSTLRPVSTVLEKYDANLVALPQERLQEFRRLLAERNRH